MVRFLKYKGFDKQYAVFEDDNNIKYEITERTYSLLRNKSPKKNKITKFDEFKRESSIIVLVNRYYLNHKIYWKRNRIYKVFGQSN